MVVSIIADNYLSVARKLGCESQFGGIDLVALHGLYDFEPGRVICLTAIVFLGGSSRVVTQHDGYGLDANAAIEQHLADVLWNDLMINLSDGTGIASWDDIRSEDFPDYYWSLPVGTLNLGGYNVKLIAWETQHDDYLSVGDYLMFKFEESIPENVTYSVSITSKSTGAELAYFDLSAAM
ncbi:MAG: hypothetical protein JSU93_05840 [Methanobacteriota archaeon]|nr:MAG: hypothetical protein JSU93_05840 [Euryarchaeota archaeon]